MKNLLTFEAFLVESANHGHDKTRRCQDGKQGTDYSTGKPHYHGLSVTASNNFFPADDKTITAPQREIANLLRVKSKYQERIICVDENWSMRGRNGLAYDFLTKSWQSDLSAPILIDGYTLDYDKRRIVKLTDSDGDIAYFWVLQSKFNWS